MKTYNMQEKIAQAFRTEAEKVAQQVASFIGKPTDSQEIDPEEELTLWWEEGISPEEASQLFASGADIDQVLDQRFPNRRFMLTYQRPDPEQQISYAVRMDKLSKEKNWEPSKGEAPNVHGESAGELQSTVEPF